MMQQGFSNNSNKAPSNELYNIQIQNPSDSQQNTLHLNTSQKIILDQEFYAEGDLDSPARRKTFPALQTLTRPYSSSANDSPSGTARDDLDSPASVDKSDTSKKRGKYTIYTEEDKQKILDFIAVHGVDKALAEFGSKDDKITKRKLKGWMDSQNKIKGVKGRKTKDADRDTHLHEWCIKFQQDKGRAPTRKEASQVALEFSKDSDFKASKGWLDKFSKKYQIEFTPLKVFPTRSKKIKKEGDGVDSSEGLQTPSYDGTSSYYSGSHVRDSEEEGQASEAEDKEGGVIKFPQTESFFQHQVGHNDGMYQNFDSSHMQNSSQDGQNNHHNQNNINPNFQGNQDHSQNPQLQNLLNPNASLNQLLSLNAALNNGLNTGLNPGYNAYRQNGLFMNQNFGMTMPYNPYVPGVHRVSSFNPNYNLLNLAVRNQLQQQPGVNGLFNNTYNNNNQEPTEQISNNQGINHTILNPLTNNSNILSPMNFLNFEAQDYYSRGNSFKTSELNDLRNELRNESFSRGNSAKANELLDLRNELQAMSRGNSAKTNDLLDIRNELQQEDRECGGLSRGNSAKTKDLISMRHELSGFGGLSRNNSGKNKDLLDARNEIRNEVMSRGNSGKSQDILDIRAELRREEMQQQQQGLGILSRGNSAKTSDLADLRKELNDEPENNIFNEMSSQLQMQHLQQQQLQQQQLLLQQGQGSQEQKGLTIPISDVKVEDKKEGDENSIRINELNNAFSEIDLNGYMKQGEYKGTPRNFDPFIGNGISPQHLEVLFNSGYLQASPHSLELLLGNNRTPTNFSSFLNSSNLGFSRSNDNIQ